MSNVMWVYNYIDVCATRSAVKYELETESCSLLIHTIDEIEFPIRERDTLRALCRGKECCCEQFVCVCIATARDHCLSYVSVFEYVCVCVCGRRCKATTPINCNHQSGGYSDCASYYLI